MGRDDDTKADVLDYHERTKHHTFRYAAGPGYLDWASQPDPFRRYAGAPLHRLPVPPLGNPLPYPELYRAGSIAPAALDLPAISLFLRYALSLTAWKQIESSRWALRANPSSGNLHPTEGYLILPAIVDLGEHPAVYHYAPREHGLERRAELDDDAYLLLTRGFPGGSFLAGLSSVHWREAWKYGERAFRYCQHDVGHAVGSLRLAAAALGWNLRLLDRVSDRAIASLLGLDRTDDYGQAEPEHPDLLVVVTTRAAEPGGPGPATDGLPDELADAAADEAAVMAVRGAKWCGRANTLSAHHAADWPIIDRVAAAAEHHGSDAAITPPPAVSSFASFPRPEDRDDDALAASLTAERVILGRRSAVAMDGVTGIDPATLYRMLARVVPGIDNTAMPWDAIPWRPHVHLALFVHRVDGLRPGLYVLARDPDKVAMLRAAMTPDFAWERPDGCPPALPLFLLRARDVRQLATQVSCGQDIAGDGAFSLGMLAELRAGLERFGPSAYRRLHWEAGLIGQVLYLEAEAAGIRATGIGCYFDDHMHDVIGVTGNAIQSLYHFTVGAPVEDQRLTTLPAYPSDADG